MPNQCVGGGSAAGELALDLPKAAQPSAAAVAARPEAEDRSAYTLFRPPAGEQWAAQAHSPGPAEVSGVSTPMRGVPRASLVGPHLDARDLEPTPVPRVSLAASTGAIDRSLIPSSPPTGLNEPPTLVPNGGIPFGSIPSAAGEPRGLGSAAMTMPPAGARGGHSGGQVLSIPPSSGASSKQEVVTGLAIGIAVSLLLGVLGQAYLDSRGQAAASSSVSTAELPLRATASSQPPARPAAAVASSPALASPSAAIERTPREHWAESEWEERAAPSGGRSPIADSVESLPAPRAEARPHRRPVVRKRRTRKPVSGQRATPPGKAAPRSPSASGPSSRPGPLSPSERAGLGLELELSD